MKPTHTVRRRRYYYGPKSSTSYACNGTRQECAAFVALQSSGIPRLGNNESSAPTYRIVTIASLYGTARSNAICAEPASRWLQPD